ncbi:MAG TPA: energy transducer TonB, partial [Niabella sp.]|nr:energy transducer TonB [Niabella sp.]
MLTYLLQMMACSGILYGYYHFFLRNERFHQYNRFYLLFSIMLSLVLPLIKIPVQVTEADPSSPMYLLVSSGENIVITAKEKFDVSSLVYILYGLIVLLLLTRLLFAIKKIISIKRNSATEQFEDIQFINTAHDDAPFSFFKWLFWNNKTSLQSAEGEQIFKHEMYHIRSKHSRDLIFIEIVLAVFWFNPFFYLYRKELKMIQEFLADKHAAEGYDATSYAELLLLRALGSHQRPLVNPFFHTQLKRRIAMLLSSKKPQHQWLRKLLVLPIAAIVIALFGFTYKKEIKEAVAALPEITNKKISPSEEQGSALENESIPFADILEKKDTTPKKINATGKEVSAEYVTATDRYRKLNPITVVGFSEQEEPKRILKEGEVKIDVEAGFPGDWSNFLERNIDGQIPTEKGAPAGNYEVLVRFTINEDGKVSDIQPLTNEGYGMEDEVIRILRKSPDWRPALNNKEGEAKEVKSYRIQPINFQVVREVKKENAQMEPVAAVNKREPEIFTKTEIEAQYPGNWRNYLEKNLNGLVPVDNGAKQGTYTTVVQFIVDKDGNTSDFKALTTHGHGMEEEALRAIKASGKWKPAIQNGR